MKKIKNKKGFTLVELSLSIAFISILSITVALIINDAIATYQRGLTLNQINTVGMELVDDMRAAIQGSSAGAVTDECSPSSSPSNTTCKDNGAELFVMIKKTKNTDVDDDGKNEDVPIFGAFCTGTYSYIWNSGYFWTENKPLKNEQMAKLTTGDKREFSGFRLLKVKDQRRMVCIGEFDGKDINAKKENYGKWRDGDISNEFKIDSVDGNPEVILAGDSNDSNNPDSNNPLALYDLSVPAPATNDLGTASFYSVSFILGTVQGGINVMSTGNFCKTPEGYSSLENFNYCAINKFNFAAQATGG